MTYDPKREREINERFERLGLLIAEVPEELIDEVYADMQKDEIWDTCFNNKEFDCEVFQRSLDIWIERKAAA